MSDNPHDPNLYPPQVDPKHYFFVRESGLPRGYFRSWRPTADQCVFWVCVAAAVIAVIWSL
jgi:hypothetical protein